ncbi:hypothetical protein [Agromyces sp. PvR057]|uniref:hypothetical protein n=1 Tax=Agromyces sp. PvR057 TaxID=3156403 RepID=UPI000E2285D4
MTLVHRLTVDGRDYFLPDPVTELKQQVLEAIKAGGGYVNIPPLRGGPGIDILFSPGMPVTWSQIDVGGDLSDRDENRAGGDSGDEIIL